MMPRIMWLGAHLLMSTVLATAPALAGTGEDRIQLCWALGALDNTIYFAEVQGREDRQKSFADLQALIAKTLAFIDAIPAEQIDGQEAREIVLRPGTPKEKKFNGQAYLLSFGLPQFFFHVTTTYAILRHNGIEIGKRDYMGAY